MFSVRAPVSYPSDPQPLPGARILLADYASPGHILIIDHAGRVLWRYGPTHGYGRLDHPSLAMALPNGDIAVNDDYRDRVVVIDPRTNEDRVAVWAHRRAGHRAAAIYTSRTAWTSSRPGPRGGPDYAAVVHP